MGNINVGRVILGGLLASLIIFISEYVLNTYVIAEESGALMQRRKMLSNALKHYDPTAPAVLALAGIDGTRRPETLTLAEFSRLAELFVRVRQSQP